VSDEDHQDDYGFPRLPAPFRRWFDEVRVIVLFLLGVVLIVYAVVTPGHDTTFIVAGLFLCGLVPIDSWLSSRRPRKNGDG
jgi:hypothetical protein